MAEIFNFYVQDNRTIQFPKANLLEPIMQEDYKVATWRFRIPKVLNGIDMSAWAWWFVYTNAKNEKFSELLTLVDDIDEPDSYCTADYDIDYGISYNPGSFSFSLEAINAESGGAITGEWHTKTYSHKVDKTLQGNQAEWAETESDIISALIVEVQNKVAQLVGGATPEPVSLIADMTDTSKVYLYVGSETGESTNYWYYYNGSAWVAGGLYASSITVDSIPTQGSTNAVSSGGVKSALDGIQAEIPTVDSTLSQSGQAADAKAVGDKIGSLKTDLTTFENDSGVRYNVEFTKVTGKYIGSDNNEKSVQYFSRSVPIAVAVGDVIEFTATGYNKNVAMIALTDAEETFYKSVARSVDSTQRTYTYTCIDSGYIIVSYENRNSYSLTIKSAMSNTGLNNSVNKLYEAGALQLVVDSGIVVSVDDVTATVSQTGHYINSSGVYSDSANFNMYYVSLQKGDTISFNAKGYVTIVAVLARINSDGTYTPLINSEDSDAHSFVYSAPEVMNVCISSHINTPPRYSVFSSRIDINWVQINDLYKNKLIELSYDAEINTIADNIAVNLLATGCYIRNDGTYRNDSGSLNFKIYGNITLPKGSKIKFNAAGYNTNIAVLARVNSDGTYTPLIISEDSNEHEFSYIALTKMTVVISSHKSVTPSYSLCASRIDKNAAKIHDINSNYVAFATIGVLGDSLASGASNYPPDGAADRKDYAWGKFIEREHGISVSLFSSGGATTRSWLAQSYGLAALQAANMLDCYIIGLGVNDAYSLGDAYLGSVSDVHVGNEDENADTYYGNYSKIIAAIKTKSPRAKIFCITNPRGTDATGVAYNGAVEDIVGLYTNTYLIDLREDSFYTSPEFKSTWYSAHSTAVGYKLIAQNIYNHLNDIIQENVKEFLDIQWIVNNHD